MADTKISALGAAATLVGTEAIPAVQAGANVRLTPAQVLTYGGTGKGRVTTTDPNATQDASAGYAPGSLWMNTVNGVRWTCLDATPGAAAWAPQGALDHPGYVAAHWYGFQRGATANVTAVANSLFAVPLYVAKIVDVVALGMRTGASGGGNVARLAIYSNGADGRPDALLSASNEGNVSGASVDVACTLPATLRLYPGIYWIAALFDSTPQMLGVNPADQLISSLVGAPNLTNAIASAQQITSVLSGTAVTYATGFPASFGTSTARPGSSGTPLMAFKVAG